MDTDRIVIVGAGHAGVALATAVREDGHTGPLTILHGESHPPYDRPGLSKHLLASADAEPSPLRASTFFASRGMDLVQARVTGVDCAARQVVSDDGRTWGYDHLVLATGGVPRSLPVPGADLAGVAVLRSLDDAREVRARLATATEVVVVGGGFIGLEVAAAARARGASVVLLEAADRLMGRVVTPQCSAAAVEFHRGTGVDVRLGCGLAALRGEGVVSGVELADGSVLPADLVVVGVGMAADDDLARAAGLATDRGVLVDATLRTSDPCISAIGDCAVLQDPRTGVAVRLESIQNATDQARHLAAGLLGADRGDYRAVPWFWSTQGALKLQMVGLVVGTETVVATGTGARRSLLCFRGGVLVAVESINDPGTHMTARRLLGRGVLPTHADLAAVDFDLRTVAKAKAAAA